MGNSSNDISSILQPSEKKDGRQTTGGNFDYNVIESQYPVSHKFIIDYPVNHWKAS